MKKGLLDGLYSKVYGWLWVETEGMAGRCDLCRGGRAAYPAGGRLLTRIYHKKDGRRVWCKSPWFWRGRMAAGKLRAEDLGHKEGKEG